MVMFLRRGSYILVTVLSFLTCKVNNNPPDITEFQSRVFDSSQLDELSVEVENWIQICLERYNGVGPHLSGKEWKIVKPICLSADGSRAILTLLMRSPSDGGVTFKNSMTWIGAFKYKSKWYFNTIIGTQYVDSQLYGLSEGVPLPWVQFEKIGIKETSGYLKYDSTLGEWTIDDWSIWSQVHNLDLIQKEYGDLSPEEIMELPQEKFMDIEMPSQLGSEYVQVIVEREFEKQYQNYLAGKYTEEEWSELEDMRQRRTDQGKRAYLLFRRDISRSDEVKMYRDTVKY